jgi:NAD(P)-dependent dehydrogenase (short-subunit alcohol dehydrogenase family)
VFDVEVARLGAGFKLEHFAAFLETAGKLKARAILVAGDDPAIAPTVIAPDLVKQMSDEAYRSVLAKIPLGRAGRPEEFAAMIAWPASEESSFSTGAVFDLSGGRATY